MAAASLPVHRETRGSDGGDADARADFCRFLAACYYEPDVAFAQERLFESMAAAGARIDAELAAGARRLGVAFAAARLEDLLVDYTRLFLGPIDAPARPYGSVWMDRAPGVMGDSTMAVMELYEEGGFELAEDFREPPDHIAAELEFLYLLLLRRGRSPQACDAGGLAQAQGLRRRLLDEHLGCWAGPFCEAVQSNAETGFYRELAGITRRFLAGEAGRASA